MKILNKIDAFAGRFLGGDDSQFATPNLIRFQALNDD